MIVKNNTLNAVHQTIAIFQKNFRFSEWEMISLNGERHIV